MKNLSISLRNLNKCDFFLISWVLYYLQGILYPKGSIISIILLFANLCISVLCAFKVVGFTPKPLYFKGLNHLIILFSIYGLIHILFNPTIVHYIKSGVEMQNFNYLKNIYISLLPIYAFYYFAQKGYLTEYKLKIWGLIFLLSCTLSYIQYQQEALQALVELGSTREEITNNTGYIFVACLPLIVIYQRKPLLQYILLAFVMIFIVLGMKRGAMAIGLLCMLAFLRDTIRSADGRKKILIIVLSCCFCAAAVTFFLYQMENSSYLMQRILDTKDGNSSGRDDLYFYFWRYFTQDASLIHFICGRGANGTLDIYYNYAHNDWLEIAVNQGIIGIVIYFLYWIRFYKTWKYSNNHIAKTILGLSILIYLSETMISMSYADMTYIGTCMLGYALANVNTPN